MKIIALTLILIMVVSISFCTHADSVWVAEKSGNKVFVGGTVHMLSAKDYPLPEAFNKAYQLSDELLFETDIASLSSMETQMRIVQQLTHQDGKTIADELEPETLKKLEQHFKTRGMSLEMFKSFKAGFIGLTITAVEMQLLGVTAKGVDDHFKSKAVRDNKPVSWFESVDDQVGFIIGMAEGKEDELINYFLDSTSDTKTVWDSMLADWREGDMDSLNKQFLVPLEQDYPQMNEVLITSRNDNWMPKIKALFDDQDTEFVLVGALHLAGKNGLLSQLEQAGYTVSKVE